MIRLLAIAAVTAVLLWAGFSALGRAIDHELDRAARAHCATVAPEDRAACLSLVGGKDRP